MNFDKVFVLTDDNTYKCCLPVIKDVESVKDATVITIPSGDDNKNLESVSHVWQELSRGGATRHSLLVNVGGGVVTDLGGFAAGTFKRGIRYINIPTTLLSMVDASVGGKTGINFEGLKNETLRYRIRLRRHELRLRHCECPRRNQGDHRHQDTRL